MASPRCIAVTIRTLRAARLGNAPATDEESERTAGLWLGVLADIDDATLGRAIIAHMKASRFWPAPHDLIAASGLNTEADPDAPVWDRIHAAVSRGAGHPYAADPQANTRFVFVRDEHGVETARPVPIEVATIPDLEGRHIRALGTIGGLAAVRRAGEGEDPAAADRTRATLRKRFLTACKEGALVVAGRGASSSAASSPSSTPTPAAPTEDRPSFPLPARLADRGGAVGRFMGPTEAPERAAQRARIVAEALRTSEDG